MDIVKLGHNKILDIQKEKVEKGKTNCAKRITDEDAVVAKKGYVAAPGHVPI